MSEESLVKSIAIVQKSQEIQLISSFFPKDRLFFDIGVNKGDYTEHLLAFEPRQVICVEPNVRRMKRLRHRFPDEQKVVLVNKAAYHTSGLTMEFDYCHDDDGASCLVDSGMQTDSRESTYGWKWEPTTIETISIDDLVKQYGHPNWIKVDAEGSEYKIVKGMSHPYSIISFEWLEEKIDEIILSIEHMMSIGYRYFGVTAGDHYSVIPRMLIDGQSIIEFMKSLCLKERQEMWGMFWAFPDTDAFFHIAMIHLLDNNLIDYMGSRHDSSCKCGSGSATMVKSSKIRPAINSTDDLCKCTLCNRHYRIIASLQKWENLELPWNSDAALLVPFTENLEEIQAKALFGTNPGAL